MAGNSIRPERETPETGQHVDKRQLDAEIAHEDTLRYFVEHTELGVLDKEQMGVISLVDSCGTLGLHLPATSRFFERLRQLSSGEEGKGRVQVKEVITAGSFPMNLLFGEQRSGILDMIKGWFGKKNDTPPQKGM